MRRCTEEVKVQGTLSVQWDALCLGFRVQGLGFRVWGSELRVQSQ